MVWGYFLPGTLTLNPFSSIFFSLFFSSFSTFFRPALIMFIFCLFFYAKLCDVFDSSLFSFFVPFAAGWFTVHLLPVVAYRFCLLPVDDYKFCLVLAEGYYILGFDGIFEFLFSNGFEFIFASSCLLGFSGISGKEGWLNFLNLGSFSFSSKYFKKSSFFYNPKVVYELNVYENLDWFS